MDNSKNWEEIFTQLNALWIHDGNPEHPHALLTSGKHSSGYFNATKIVEQPQELQYACDTLSDKVSAVLREKKYKSPQVVVGSAFGAITIAHECAKKLDAKMAFTQKENGLMSLSRFSINEGEQALVVEDVLTTGNTTRKTIKELERYGADVAPVIAVLVNRLGKNILDGREIISLIENPMPRWDSEDCPLCKGGSEALRPKNEWLKLTQSY